MIKKLRDVSQIDVVDEDTRVEWIMARFMGHYVIIHPRESSLPITPKQMLEVCMGYLIDGNAGGFVIEQTQKDGTKTHTYYPIENVGMIHDVNLPDDTADNEQQILNENLKNANET